MNRTRLEELESEWAERNIAWRRFSQNAATPTEMWWKAAGRWKTDVFVYCHSDLVLLLDFAVRSHNRQVKLDATVFLKYQPWVGIWIQSGQPARFKQSYIKRERARDSHLPEARRTDSLQWKSLLLRIFRKTFIVQESSNNNGGRCTVLQLWCNHCYFIIRAYQSCCVKL